MKRGIAFLLMLLVSFSVLISPLPARSASNSFLSLEDKNIVMANSNIELTCTAKDGVFALVNYQGQRYLFVSRDNGATWQRGVKSLPGTEKFVSLEASSNATLVAIATATQVYLSRDGGGNFESLGGPLNLVQRGEEITSLAINDGISPQILVGVWNPTRGKFPDDGVYFWGLGSDQWAPQGMKPPFLQVNKGYFADVTSVAFVSGLIVAVATGDPDGSGPLAEGTYLNIGVPSEVVSRGADWNFFSGQWPIELSQSSNQSPKESEIVNSKLVTSLNSGEGKVYVAYNTLQKGRDDVYLIWFAGRYTPLGSIRKLEIPKIRLSSIDSIDYSGSLGNLAIGVTLKGQTATQEAAVYSLDTAAERLSPPYWYGNWLKQGTVDAFNCQAMIAPDGVICAAVSGQSSCFARSEGSNLVPISLINNLAGGISQVLVPEDFLSVKTLFLNYGNQNLIRVKLDKDYKLVGAQRALYTSGAVAALKMIRSDQNIFVFEARGKRFWLSRNGGLSWAEPKDSKTQMLIDAVFIGNEIWCADVGGRMSQISDGGDILKSISSGFSWVQKIEPGPQGKVLAVGGSRDGFAEGISVFDGNRYDLLPPFPATTYSEVRLAYSQKDNSIYCLIGSQLYRLIIGSANWERIIQYAFGATEIFSTSQGIYLFSYIKTYFSPFPISQKSSWPALEGEEFKSNWSGCELVGVDGRTNFLVLWYSGRVAVYNHDTSVIPSTTPASPTLKPTPAPTLKPTPTVRPTPSPTVLKPKPVPTAKPPSAAVGPSVFSKIGEVVLAIGRGIFIGIIVIVAIIIVIGVILFFRRPRH